MMFRLSSLIAPLVLFWVTVCTSIQSAEAGVDFCGVPGRLPPMDRFDCLIHVNPNVSCGQLFFQMAGFPRPNSYTNQIIGAYSHMCCNANVPMRCLGHPGGNQGGQQQKQPQQQPQQNVGRPSGYGGRGPNGTCNICRNGGTLQDTFNGAGQKLHYNLRYIGRANAGFSCSQFDWLGKNGYIPNFMCGPVMSILPRYCPVCSGGASQQQAAPQQAQQQQNNGRQCGLYRNNKNGCKQAGCRYNKKFGTCSA